MFFKSVGLDGNQKMMDRNSFDVLNHGSGRSVQEMILSRKTSWISALALLAGMAFATPSQAASVLVTTTFSRSASSNNIQTTVLTYTGLNGISNLSYNVTALNQATAGPPPTFGLSTVTETTNGAQTKLTFAYNPFAKIVNGTVQFWTTTNTNDLNAIAASIHVSANAPGSTSTTISFSIPAAVPEPTSSAMFGIGIALAVGLGWARKRRELSRLAV